MPSLNLQQLSDRVYNRLDSNAQLYPQSQVTDTVNEAIVTINLLTGFLQVTVPMLSVANRHFYDTPAALLIPLRCQFERGYLGTYGLNEVGRAHPRWTQETTANTCYPVQYFIPLGLRKFAIHPADANGGGNMQITGIQEPVPLVNPTDTVNFPSQYLGAFDAYAAHCLQLKEGGSTFMVATLQYKEFLRIAKQITIWKSWTQPAFPNPEGRQKR